MLPPQTARCGGSRTRPIQLAESPRAIHFAISPMVGALQAQTSPIFGIQNAATEEFPTSICFHYSQPGPVDSILHLLDALNLLASSILSWDHWLLCYSHRHHQFSEFRMRDGRIPHINMLSLQSARASGSHTAPTRCAESPGAIHSMIGLLAAEIQQQTSSIFGIQNCKMKECPTLICSHYRQPGAADAVQDLFN